MNMLRKITVFILMLALLPMAAMAQKAPKGKDQLVTISTPHGEMKLVLFDDTPLHKENFLKLARQGFYDGTTFHRVIDGFMIQGGDPNTKDDDPRNDGAGNPGYTVPAEIKPRYKHVRGALAAARMGDQVNPKKESSGSQFYIVENHQGTPQLDEAYTVYGQVIDGLEVIDKIAAQAVDGRNRPLSDIPMKVKVEEVKKKKIAKKYRYTYQQAD
ncbi:peptidylprolyl isomerase [Pontibacter sp. HSC-36F09]|uniref:peptidylprolyl isomerase n=1 Tax=Pontibacter sp. HSC-36F09 TaxID=2910966 RepID=UPI00209DEA66|nr:peptidylprolyl isomerase [Pontibacter sp. HSC-36F09]MCP2042370.1 peptidyl-prolyl cis-trans isomerase B (cyclophilin B) [Pontibacter sp. HSC-36F09]